MSERGFVWVVEMGEYSNYRVAGAYTSEENATAVAARINGEPHNWSEATVAKWPLDVRVEEAIGGLSPFRIWMLRDGTTLSVDHDYWPEHDAGGVGINVKPVPRWPRFDSKWQGVAALEGRVFARDEQHAVKIVNEKRAQLVASNRFELAT